jgi:hypothetical protein
VVSRNQTLALLVDRATSRLAVASVLDALELTLDVNSALEAQI